jgi:hypothetical protein
VTTDLVSLDLSNSVYNEELRWECVALAGRWDRKTKSWTFPAEQSQKVEHLNKVYNSDFVDVEICFLKDYRCLTLKFELAGYQIATGAMSNLRLGIYVKQKDGDKPSITYPDDYLFHRGTILTARMTRTLITKVAQEWKGTLSLRDTAQPNCANDLVYVGWTW